MRWADRILRVDGATGTFTTIASGFNPDGGIARLSGDGRWLYMLDSRDEGDLWMAGRGLPPARGASAGGGPR